MKKLCLIMLVLSVIFIGFSCNKTEKPAESKKKAKEAEKKERVAMDKTVKPVAPKIIQSTRELTKIQAQLKKLAPVDIGADLSILDENEKNVLKLIVKAARYMDDIFLTQVYVKNNELKEALLSNKTAEYETLYRYFMINFGPFDRLDKDQPFINSDQKPAGANYYQGDISKEMFNQWITDHPESEKAFTSNFTLIKREGDQLKAIPYSEAYRDLLEPAAKLLKEASVLSKNTSLKKFLSSRADAFLSNDYFQSDIDWVELKDHKIEVVIGPYEVYEDAMFGYKAAFESFVTIVDPEESKKLQVVGEYLDELERNLPIEEKYMNFNRGKSSPIKVVNEVYTAGDTKAGVQTAAFNLPNDEKVRETKGSKKVMLKNVTKAKYDKCYIPISKVALSEKDRQNLSFDAFFNHILLHEMAHGLGPGIIEKNGKKTTVNKELADLYSVIEEAKADILGVWCFKYLIDKGVFPKHFEKQIYVSFLGGIFRSVRFGINAAHGGANVMALNYLIEKEGYYFDKDTRKFGVNQEKVLDAFKQLSTELLMIEALGDYDGAKVFVNKYRKVSPELQEVLDKLSDVPVDIYPVYTIEKGL